MPTDVSLDGDLIVVRGLFHERKEVGARWDAKRDAWTIPATRMNASMVRDAIPNAPDLRGRLGASWTPVPDGDLFDYQRDAVGRLVASPHGQLVVLSPGLGKTAVAVRAADRVVHNDKIVVVAPASLLRTWEREIRRWALRPGPVYIARGRWDYDEAERARWIVASWDKATLDHDVFGRGWPLLILDESVMVKSHTSKRFKAMKKIRGGFDRVWELSGNPTTRHADDLWAQLHLIWPRAYSSYWRFAERYCVVEETPWARKVVATRRRRDALKENDDLVLVVNQEEVLDLPEYLFEVVDVDLAPRQEKAYRSMARDFVTELADGTELVAQSEVARLGRLQQITSWWDGESAKHDALIDLLPSYEGPHLIWTHWVDGGRDLYSRLVPMMSVGLVNGETPPRDRDRILEDFRAGQLDALVLSIGVGKFGHTFTNAKTVWYVDKTWNADDYFQSLRRVRRIGLTHRPVVVTLRAPGTTDELVEDNLEGKLKPISQMTRSDLAELMRGLGRDG